MDSCRPERVPGIINVRPDTSDTAEAVLLPEPAADAIIRPIQADTQGKSGKSNGCFKELF